jgi:glycosyltransferase involved in cell wall biosynthesis
MSLQSCPTPRALLVCDFFIRYETGLAQGLVAQGWEPILLGRDHQHAFGGRPGALRRYISDRLGPQQRSLLLEGRGRELSSWRSLHVIGKEVRDLAPTVTHVQTCVCHDPRLVMASHLRPHRYAVTVHDVDTHPGDRLPPRRHMAIVNPLLRHAGLVFTHSEQLRQRLAEAGATGAPIIIVPHGIDDAEPQPFPESPSLLFFGRISAYKGVDVLLDAMIELWRRRPELTLTIAGEGAVADHPALHDPRLRLVNRHIQESDVPAMFADASLVVLPYIEASQSGVGSLAKGHGRPTVASAVGGLPELLSDGSGTLVAPGDPHALAGALDELLDDGPRRERMRDAGLRTLREAAGWPAVAALTVDAYARYLGAPRRRDTAHPTLTTA